MIPSNLKTPFIILCWLAVALFLYMTFGNLETALIMLLWLAAVFFLLRFAVYAAWTSSYMRGGWRNFFFGWMLLFWPVEETDKYLWPEGRVKLKRARSSLFIFLALLLFWFVMGALFESMQG